MDLQFEQQIHKQLLREGQMLVARKEDMPTTDRPHPAFQPTKMTEKVGGHDPIQPSILQGTAKRVEDTQSRDPHLASYPQGTDNV